MKLIIDIDEVTANEIKDNAMFAKEIASGIKWDITSAIVNGTPLEQEPKTGHWIFVDKAHEHAHCSECDYGNVDLLDGRPHNFCPNCGAKMFEPQERSEKE
jgi:hypothetical protein